MPSTTPSTAEPSRETRRRTAIRAAAERNYTALRVLQALEVVVLRPSTAPTVAEAVGIDARTARRILNTLATERYIERRGGPGRARHEYQPTVRLLTLAAQLASRHPLVAAGRQAVREVESEIDATAYVAVPCYSDVLVVAASGNGPIRPWATLQASSDATGWALLAHRKTWRRSLMEAETTLAVDDQATAGILERGYAEVAGTSTPCASLAVVVPADTTPIAALGVRAPGPDLSRSREAVIGLLQRTAARLGAESGQGP
jgi:DNA-binding IclR family transcriptional regulator